MTTDYDIKAASIMNSRERMREAEKEHCDNVKHHYPVGSTVRYLRHGHTPQIAVVERHGYDDVLFVENVNTGRMIKIETYHILAAVGL